MSYYLSGADEQFYTATLPFSSLPASGMTLVAWIKIASAPAATDTVLSIGDKDSSNNFYHINLNASAQIVAINDAAGSSDNNALTSVSVSNDTWSMAAAVFASDSSRRAYLNGTLDTDDTSTTATVWTSIDRICIGGTAALVQDFTGYIAHVQIYDKALSEAELDTLYGGTNPLSASTSTDLLAYWPLVSDYTASVGGTLTLEGTPTLYAADNPSVDAATTKYLKLLVHPDAATDTAVSGIVMAASTSSPLGITGDKIGEFTGASFIDGDTESPVTDAGYAVLKVAVTEFGGTSLTTSDTPLAVIFTDAGSPAGTCLISGTIIEE